MKFILGMRRGIKKGIEAEKEGTEKRRKRKRERKKLTHGLMPVRTKLLYSRGHPKNKCVRNAGNSGVVI